MEFHKGLICGTVIERAEVFTNMTTMKKQNHGSKSSGFLPIWAC